LKWKRMIPPAAAPISVRDLFRGISGMAGTDRIGKLEREIREYFGAESVFLASSGKAALVLILKGLASLRFRRKVVIPAYTCYSVPSAIVKVGLEVVPCDVDPDTLDFNYAQLASCTDEKTLCVVSTHLFGIPSDIDRARGICEQKGIFLVEDAAQAMGIIRGNRKLGTLGDVGFFSLGRGKNITCGSGGIILTSKREIADSIRKYHEELEKEPIGESIKNIIEALFIKIFLHPSLYWFPGGLPFLGIGETRFSTAFPMYRLSNSKAGMLATWRATMERYNRCRKENVHFYLEGLALRKEMKIYSRELPLLRFPVYANTPESKIEACERYGFLGISPMYPDSVNRIEQLREHFGGRECKGAERIAGTMMTLPTHVFLSAKDREDICELLGGEIDRGKSEEVSSSTDRYGGTKIDRSGG